MKTYNYEILTDESAGNPRDEWDNLSRFLCPSNSRYITGGKKDLEFNPRYDGGENLRGLHKQKALIVEFYNPQVGTCYAFVTRDQLQKEYLAYGQTIRQAFYHARQVIRGEIESYLAWANGEVYGYQVTDDEGNIIDSCWGFYGESGRKYAIEQAKDFIKGQLEDDKQEELTLLARAMQ